MQISPCRNAGRRAAVLGWVCVKRAVVLGVDDGIAIRILAGIAATGITKVTRLIAVRSEGTIIRNIIDAVVIGIITSIAVGIPRRDGVALLAVGDRRTVVVKIVDAIAIRIIAHIAFGVARGDEVALVAVGNGRAVIRCIEDRKAGQRVIMAVAVNIKVAGITVAVTVYILLVRIGCGRTIIAQIRHPIIIQIGRRMATIGMKRRTRW